MTEIFKQQYDLIKSARLVVLDFLEDQLGDKTFSRVKEFNDTSPGAMMLHVANVYFHWIGNYTLDLDIEFYKDRNVSTVSMLRSVFEEVDELVFIFLDQFGQSPGEKILGLSGENSVEFDILTLFTHVITHEFHHKGQVMSMCRLLGAVPVDSDIIRF